MEGQTRTARTPRRARSARRRAGAAAVLTASALAVLPAVTGETARAPSTTPSGPGAQTTPTGPPIRLADGRSITPALGDWEGTVGGRPASFDLIRDPHPSGSKVSPYGVDELVTISPSRCPVSSGHVHEVQLTTPGAIRLGGHGDLGLGRFGFGGELTGDRTATLSRAFHLSGCHGTQTWHMHPALRLPVSDGNWSVHFANGVRGRFRVIDGGRLAAGIPLSKQLHLCEGLTGTVDLFIGPRGTATTDDPELRVGLRFTHGTAKGRLTTAGPGCRTHRIPFSAQVLKAPTRIGRHP